MTFKVGDARPQNAGRRAGTRNRRSAAISDVIQLAAYHVGGWERLVEWIKSDPANEFAFWTSIWPRLLPMMRLHGTTEIGELGLSTNIIKPEELAQQLMARGLPMSLFDNIDVPTLDGNGAGLSAEQSNGNRDDVPPVGSNGRQYFRG